jgi:hypothetical protein
MMTAVLMPYVLAALLLLQPLSSAREVGNAPTTHSSSAEQLVVNA